MRKRFPPTDGVILVLIVALVWLTVLRSYYPAHSIGLLVDQPQTRGAPLDPPGHGRLLCSPEAIPAYLILPAPRYPPSQLLPYCPHCWGLLPGLNRPLEGVPHTGAGFQVEPGLLW